MPRLASPPAIESPTPVAFLGDSPIVARGAVTGFTYLFGAGREPLAIDVRDVAALVRTGWFATV